MASPISMIFDILAVDRASAVFGRVGAAAGAAGAESEAGMARVASAGSKMAAGFGIAVAAAGVLSVKMAADFQTATNQLVTSAGESQANLEGVRKGLLSMAGQVGVSATELAKGMYQVESAGFHGAAGLDVMRAAAQGAKAEGASMETVANALTTVLNNYGKDVQNNAVKGTDFLVAAVSLGKTRMEDFAGSISNVLPVAKMAGISLQEVGGAMATMTAQGISSDQAATYLRQTIVRLADQTPKARNEMKALGLDSVDVAGRLGERGLAGTLQVLTDAIAKHLGPQGLVMLDSLKKAGQNADQFQVALSNLPPAAQTYIGALTTMVGGQKTMMGALSLTGDHMQTFTDDTAKIGDAMGKAGKDVNGWEIVQTSFNQKLSELKASLGAVAIQLGTALLPAFTSLFGFLTDHLVPVLATAGLLLATFIGPSVVAGIGAVISSLTVLLSPVVLVAAALGGIALAFRQAYRDSEPLRQAVGVLKTSFTVFMDAFKTADSRGGVDGFFKGVRAGMDAALPYVKLGLVLMRDALWQWIKDAVKPALSALGDWAENLGRWLKENGLGLLRAYMVLFAEAMWWWVKNVDVPLLRELGKVLAALGGWLKDTALPAIVQRLADWGSAFVSWIGPHIGPMLKELASFLGFILGWAVGALVKLVMKLEDWGGAFVAWLMPHLPGLLLKLGEFLLGIMAWIVAVGIPTVAVGMLHFAEAFIGGFARGVLGSSLVDQIGGFFGRVGEAAKDRFTSAMNALKSWINDHLIDNLNSLTSTFGITAIPHLMLSSESQAPLQSFKSGGVTRMATGGVVPGNHDRDDVPILATPGEVMVPKSAVAAWGGPQALMGMLGFSGGGGAGGHYALGGLVGSAVHALMGPAADLAGRAVPAPPLAHDVAVGSVRWLGDKLGSWAGSQDAKMAAYGGPAGAPGGGAEQWRAIVVQALAMNGLGPEFANGVLSLINSESGGNPAAINLTDSNAMAGHPSQGLMQTIPGTFAANRNPGLPNSITDPLANVYAGIHYALARYGPGFLMAGGNHASGRYIGYESGTPYVPQTGLAMLHEGEAVLTRQQNRERQSTGGGVNVTLTGDFIGHDPRATAAHIERKMLDALAVYAL